LARCQRLRSLAFAAIRRKISSPHRRGVGLRGRQPLSRRCKCHTAAEPAARWLRQYELEADRDDALDIALRAIGSFGANENRVFDFAGNVWEWTNTCFVHQTLNGPDVAASTANCGVRVVEGRHRTYMTDFIRDPRTGGCAVGKPPSNLGFRLVREGPFLGDAILSTAGHRKIRMRLGGTPDLFGSDT